MLDATLGAQRLIRVGGGGRDEILDLVSLGSGELIAAGTFAPGDRAVGSRTATVAGGQAIALSFDSNLDPLRAYTAAFPPASLVASAASVLRGSLVFAGTFRGSLSLPGHPVFESEGDATDVFLLRASRLGTTLEAIEIGAAGAEVAHSLAVDEGEPRVIVGGEFGDSIVLGEDTLVSTDAQDGFVYGIEVLP